MGARVGRVFRNFNLEARAHREIGRSKPEMAPRHRGADQSNNDVPSDSDINRKNDLLLNRLTKVYVASKDPETPNWAGVRRQQKVERRPLSASLVPVGVSDVTDVEKGKLILVEALTALNRHKAASADWSVERIAQELMLTHTDAHALTRYFIPFNITVIKVPQIRDAHITDS